MTREEELAVLRLVKKIMRVQDVAWQTGVHHNLDTMNDYRILEQLIREREEDALRKLGA